MADVSMERLESAFMKAHNAGDKANAKILADEIKRRRAAPPAPAAPETQDVSVTGDLAKSGGSGLFKGIVGTLGVPGSIEQLLKQLAYSSSQKAYALPESEKAQVRDLEILGSPVGAMVDKPPQAPTQVLPTYSDVISGAASMLPEQLKPALTYQPKTAPGRIASLAGEFTGGALLPGSLTRSVLKNVLPYTAVGGAAGTVEEVASGYGGPAGLALTVPVALAQAKRGKASQMLKAIDTAGSEAKALQAASRRAGVPLTAAETISDPKIASFAEEASKQPVAAETMRPFVEARADKVPAAIERGLLEVDQPIKSPLEVSRKSAEAAQKAIESARGNRTEAVTKLYDVAKTQSVEPSAIQQIVAKAEELKVNRSPAVQKEIDDYVKQLFDKDGNPITNLGALDDIYATTRDASKIVVTDKTKAGAIKASSTISKLNGELRTVTNNASDELAAARNIFEAESEKLKSLVGDSGIDSISKSGSNPSAIVSAISGSKARASTIESVSNQLNKQDKTVFPKVARYYFEEASSQAIRGEPAKGGFRFAKSVRGSPLKQERFDAIIAGVAKAKGKNVKNSVTAANKLMDILEATGQAKGLLTPSGAVSAPGTKFGGIIERIISKFERATDAKFYNKFAEAMVSDDSINALEKLARTDATRDQYAAFLNTLIASTRDTTGGLLAGEQE